MRLRMLVRLPLSIDKVFENSVCSHLLLRHLAEFESHLEDSMLVHQRDDHACMRHPHSLGDLCCIRKYFANLLDVGTDLESVYDDLPYSGLPLLENMTSPKYCIIIPSNTIVNALLN